MILRKNVSIVHRIFFKSVYLGTYTLEYGLLSDFTNKEKFEHFLIHQDDQIFHYPDEILQKFKFFHENEIKIILLFVNCWRNIKNMHHF